jgi:hypothetical protein
MLAEYDPNVRATITYLRLLRVKVNNATIDETLQNHPDWPSLLCISDSLRKWHVPNAAGRIAKDDIAQLPLPFLAPVLDDVSPFAIVKEVSQTEVGYYPKGYKKYKLEKKEDFFKKWDGVYLIAEPTKNSGEHEYRKVKEGAYFSTLLRSSLLLLIIFQSFHFLHARIRGNSSIPILGIYFQFFALLAGVFVTLFLLWYEVDNNNPLLQKVCTGLVKTNCRAVLTGPQSKLFSWLTWSEVGFIYFGGGLLLLLFSTNSLTTTIAVLGWLSILALPYPIFSIWYQWRVAKQWCVLCISVQFLLVVSALNSITNGLLPISFDHSFTQIINALGFYLLPALVWAFCKPFLFKMKNAKNTYRDYLRIKFNGEIFDTLLKRQTPLKLPVDGLGIDIGNIKASNTLIKICNPYCGPCSKAHHKIEKLLEQHDNLRVKIIFTASNDQNDITAKPVKHLLALAEGGNEKITKKALDDWYLAEKKDYSAFASKYPIDSDLAIQRAGLEAMSSWCREMKVAATPTIFFNGYRLPSAFSIDDLKYFLSE